VEGEASQDRHLRRGIGAAHVGRWIGLGVAQFLRLGQDLVKRGAGTCHLGEDEVGRTVDDAEDLGHLSRRQALLDHADHGHHPGDGRFEAKLHAGLAGGREQLLPVLSD
jgi:hypothetical protein